MMFKMGSGSNGIYAGFRDTFISELTGGLPPDNGLNPMPFTRFDVQNELRQQRHLRRRQGHLHLRADWQLGRQGRCLPPGLLQRLAIPRSWSTPCLHWRCGNRGGNAGGTAVSLACRAGESSVFCNRIDAVPQSGNIISVMSDGVNCLCRASWAMRAQSRASPSPWACRPQPHCRSACPRQTATILRSLTAPTFRLP